ncbi:LuxR family transcriptional regulator [Rubrobacter xylanophilus]|uniref:LuxR family transcriptional regulator n=1 Tax=Rubrobacter xylanophilus TaxID=49319 RepID=A0A510HK02_9ACTN|nr:LuxR C-terminal-related transcriptional regulator [Rubrobacter xylanophilus]BBL80218.1 LuxR family transcriptional regulator [Rubrobacter xylanophilus]
MTDTGYISRRANGEGSRVEILSPRPQKRPPHNLPVPLTGFVGRERELAEISELLETNRLLTLTGPGGCGKTRLALEAAHGLRGSYPDGVWLVELASLADPELVPQAVASVLGVREGADCPVVEALSGHLRSGKLLLVLDNCEHLVEACARLAERLLVSCPGLRILATSREVLGVAGEVGLVVPPLSVPEPTRTSENVEQMLGYEAVRLFVERAHHRSPAFCLTAGNAGVVAEICRKLEGIPLAIELATARIKVLALEQISARLEDALGLLTAGGRTAPPRHRTLRAALDWSYALLAGPERRLFERLSVFAGRFSLEAAEAVGAGEGIEEEDVLDLLARLVEKSLVEAGDEDGPRYRMLEPVRQYAREKLEASGGAGRIRERHAGYYLRLAEEAEPELAGARQDVWLDRLEKEHGNLRAALSWALDGGGSTELGLRLAGALGRFWSAHDLSEGRRWLEKGLAGGDAVPEAVRAKALNEAGWISLRQDGRETVALLEESRSLFEKLGDRKGVANSTIHLACAVLHAGEEEYLEALREEIDAAREEPPDREVNARLHVFLGMVALDRGDLEEAMSLFERSLALSREIGDSLGVSLSENFLGVTAFRMGDYEQAAARFGEMTRRLAKVRDKMGLVYSLLGLAGIAAARGRPARAARLWGASEALREETGLRLAFFLRCHYDYERLVAGARSRLGEIAWSATWAEGRAMSLEEVIEYALKEERPGEDRFAGLTRREVEVLGLVARGLTNEQIAGELFISPRTVNGHLNSVYRKLGTSSRAAAARFAAEHGLL